MTRLMQILILVYLTLVTSEAARILAVFPTPSISHQVVFRPLVKELAKRGHELITVTPDPEFKKGGAPANITEIDVHDISYDIWRKTFMVISSNNDLFTQIKVGLEAISNVFEEQMQFPEVKQILEDKKQKFDLILVEALSTSALVLSHVFKAPVIQVSSFGAILSNYKVIGAPDHPILYPSALRRRIYNLSPWEKMTELYFYYKLSKVEQELEVKENKILKRIFGSGTPDLSELKNNVDMLFLNVNPIWDGNRPVPPNVIFMGGLHQNPRKELPEDLKKYLDESTKGVIYVSFGTNVNPSQLPPEKIQVLVNVLSRVEYNVLWKWDKDELPGRAGNIKIFKWLPQSDLLRHPNIKLFITQGGLQSTDESITAGVPLIGIPILGDQWFNCEKYTHHKIGMHLYIDTITEDLFRNAINTVIKDKSYQENVVRLRTLMRDQPHSPLDKAVWWTEYVLRHGGARHLKSPAANISWTEYLELELVAYLASIAAALIFGAGLAIYVLIKLSKSFMVDVKVKSS